MGARRGTVEPSGSGHGTAAGVYSSDHATMRSVAIAWLALADSRTYLGIPPAITTNGNSSSRVGAPSGTWSRVASMVLTITS